MQYRSAAWTELSKIYFREGSYEKALDYASKSLDFNRYNLDAYKLMAIIYRLQKNKPQAQKILNTLLTIDPLNHFARFENYLYENTEAIKKQFVSVDQK